MVESRNNLRGKGNQITQGEFVQELQYSAFFDSPLKGKITLCPKNYVQGLGINAEVEYSFGNLKYVDRGFHYDTEDDLKSNLESTAKRNLVSMLPGVFDFRFLSKSEDNSMNVVISLDRDVKKTFNSLSEKER